MKNGWKELVLAIVLAWGIPWVVTSMAEVVSAKQELAEKYITETEQIQSTVRQTISLWDGSQVKQTAMSDYLTGVLLGEMPGEFHEEAKKAQAVVARTYALRRMAGNSKHPGAVCTDSSCCQGYLDPDTFGDQETVRIARMVVEATAAQVLTYEGTLIDATYFSCSGGMTEDAVAVWGSDVPYLQSVESPGEEIAAHYTDTVFFSKAQLETLLDVKLSGEKYVGAATYTEGGGVASMVIGGESFRGTQLRSLLGLRSTAFTVEVTEDGITFTTKGYGHRVGMSQYGAQAMALSGSTYEQILSHYYQGTTLTVWEDKRSLTTAGTIPSGSGK